MDSCRLRRNKEIALRFNPEIPQGPSLEIFSIPEKVLYLEGIPPDISQELQKLLRKF